MNLLTPNLENRYEIEFESTRYCKDRDESNSDLKCNHEIESRVFFQNSFPKATAIYNFRFQSKQIKNGGGDSGSANL